ncbi:MAG: hypothetical protein J4G04_07360 [Nitrosopumilaceae archaeon]|nr:hypothetical protein [Nitrosopumilaceae archaeon]
MASRRRRSKAGGTSGAFALTIADAVDAATRASSEASMAAYSTVTKKPGLPAVFAAARAAVADVEPGNIGLSVFDEAMISATAALADSIIPVNYDRIRGAVASIPDRIVWMAARQAAGDLFHRMPGAEASGGRRLLDRMRAAAVKAAEDHLKREECIPMLRAADEESRGIAENAALTAAETIRTGVPTHAATAAVFGVAIRDVPPGELADAVEEACENLPEVARRHDALVVGLVSAISTMILADAISRRKYQTATRGAENLSLDEAATQIINTVTGSAFEAVYMALAASAYATSDGSAFESVYEDALAAACEVKRPKARLSKTGGMPDNIPTDLMGDMPKEAFRELYQQLSNAMELMLSSEADLERQRRFLNASEVDYKDAASSSQMRGIISLYEESYRAGYKGAGAAEATGG